MVAFEKRLTKQQLRNRAKQNWGLWRLVLDGKLPFDTVFYDMSLNQVYEANAALDLYIKLQKDARKNRNKL